VRPRYVSGDMVSVVPVHMTGSLTVPAMVISVRQSNDLPDARFRGLTNLGSWSYWVLTTDNVYCGVRVMGPLMGYEVFPCQT